jgi:hypothetical protein
MARRGGLDKISLKGHHNQTKNMDILALGNLCSERIIYPERKEFKADSYQMFVHTEMKSGSYCLKCSNTSLKHIAILWKKCCTKVKKVKDSSLYQTSTTENQDNMIRDIWTTYKESQKSKLLTT